MRRKQVRLIGIAALAGVTMLVTVLVPEVAFLRLVLALPLVLVLPGYSILNLSRDRPVLDRVAMAAYTVALSGAVAILAGFALNLTSLGLRTESWTVLLTTVTVSAVLLPVFEPNIRTVALSSPLSNHFRTLVRTLGLGDWSLRMLLANSGSIVGTAAITNGLGFAYWIFAARRFPAGSVGLASASISAMTLLGTVSALGLGTVLVRELPRHPELQASMLMTSVLVVGAMGAVLGVAFAIASPLVAHDFEPLTAGFGTVALFASGASLTAIGLVFDTAILGVLQGHLQLLRNATFAALKLVALVTAGVYVANQAWWLVFATWVLGSLVSFGLVATTMNRSRLLRGQLKPGFTLLRQLTRAALGHHFLNLTLQAPVLMLPLLVTTLLSAAHNAPFYIAWTIAWAVFVPPTALTMGLYAVGSSAPARLLHSIRVTIALGLALACGGAVVILLAADLIMHVFGPLYAAEGSSALRILALGVVPMTIKTAYVALSRLRGQQAAAGALLMIGSMLEIILAAGGAILAGLPGLSTGWVVALCIEALVAWRTVRLASIEASSKAELWV